MTTFGPILVPDAIRDAVSDEAWLATMLDAERALATAEGRLGAIPAEAATAIAGRCEPGGFDLAALLEQGRAVGNPAEPLVRALRAAVEPVGKDAVHLGATSQDVV
ncbi:MAG: 3-carboxy-cis,cis-muconate cycloisomerase, partial [Gaiellaceae bacterium]